MTHNLERYRLGARESDILILHSNLTLTEECMMEKSQTNMAQVHELLYQALETEMGGIKIYESAVQCAVNPDLKKEWQSI